ncbi:MAG: transglycosylase SLT domain-containing protein [Prevotella sp.]|nr:transglycosylase SLT domain-containing protein [Prevotella sp.]
MLSRLESGQADIIAYMLPKDVQGSDSLLFCGTNIRLAKNTHVKKSPSQPSTKEQKTPSSKETVASSKKTEEKTDSVVVQWAVGKNNQELADALNRWYKPGMYDEMKKEEHFLLSSASVKRRVFSPFLNRSSGVISKYDDLFRKYAPVARWDWRLIAAQCYQESCFDPNARSWAGARGLMQIMPSTAAHLGLSMDQIHQPEPNIAAAVRYIRELSQTFSDIPSAGDRQCFVLASYNGGSFHVRDAMALTKKNGGNPKRWGDVSRYLRLLSDPQYYKDPVVKHGYMRPSETLDYVDKIRMRYAQYRGVPVGKMSSGQSVSPVAPRKAKKKYRFKV